MNIDFQIAVTPFGQIVQRALEDRLPTLGDLGEPFLYLDKLVVIDHVEVARVTVATVAASGLEASPTTSTTIRAPGAADVGAIAAHPPLVVTAAVRTPLVTLADLAMNGSAETARQMPVAIGLALTVGAQVRDGVTELELAVASWGIRISDGMNFVDPAPVLGERFADLDRRIRAAGQRISLDTRALARMLPTGMRPWNAGITLAGGVVTLRLQFESGASTDAATRERALAEWTAFYTTGPTDRTAGSPWSLFVDERAFTGLLESQLTAAIEAAPNVDILADHPPHATWTTTTAGPRLSATTDVVSRGACASFGTDIRATVNVGVDLSAPRPGILRLDLQLDTSPYAGDVFLCVTAEVLIGAVIGGAIGALGGVPGLIIGAIVGGVGGLIHSVISLSGGGGASPTALGGFTPVPGSPNRFVAEQSLVIPGGDVFGELAFTSIGPSAAGLVVRGTFGAIATGRRARLAVDRVDPRFEWRLDGACYAWSVMAAADVGVSNGGDLPLAMWAPRYLDDSLGYAGGTSRIDRPRAPVRAGGGARLGLRIDQAHTEALRAAPEPRPCRILIPSSGGARVLTIAGIDATLTDARREELEHGRMLECRVRDLDVRTRLRRPFPRVVPFDPRGPVEWAVRARGLAATDRVRIVDGDHVLATIAPGGDGVAAARWFVRKGEVRPLFAEVVPGPGRKLSDLGKDALVVAGGLAYRELGTLTFAEELIHVALTVHRDRPCLTVTDARRATSFDVTNPGAARPIAQWSEAATPIGATFLDGRLQVWTARGPWSAARAPLPVADKRVSVPGAAAVSTAVLRGEAKATGLGHDLPPVRLGHLAAVVGADGRSVTLLELDAAA